MPEVRRSLILPADERTSIPWGHSTVSYLARGSDSGEGWCISVGSVPPGSSAPPHRHTFDEGFYVLSGVLRLHSGDSSFELTAGAFAQVPAGVTHWPANDTDGPAEILVVAAPAGFDRFQKEASTDDPEELAKRIAAIAPNYGIEMIAPAEAVQMRGEIVVRAPGEGRTVDAAGDRYRFLADSTTTQSRYALWHATVPAGGGPPPHVHSREEEAFFVLSGTVAFYLGDERHEVGAGGFVHLARGDGHRFHNESGETATMLIMVAPGGNEGLFFRFGHPVQNEATPIAPMTPTDIEFLTDNAADYGVKILA